MVHMKSRFLISLEKAKGLAAPEPHSQGHPQGTGSPAGHCGIRVLQPRSMPFGGCCTEERGTWSEELPQRTAGQWTGRIALHTPGLTHQAPPSLAAGATQLPPCGLSGNPHPPPTPPPPPRHQRRMDDSGGPDVGGWDRDSAFESLHV